LCRPNFVNRAPAALFGFLQEYTIASVRVLDNRKPETHAPQEFLFQLLHRHFQKIRYQPDFRSADQDISPFRSGAAAPALQTLKMQPSRIPRKFIAEIHRDYFTTENN
jgi:hypothetical protein